MTNIWTENKKLIEQWILDEKSFQGETTIEVAKDHLKEILLKLKSVGFEVLMDLSAVDYLKPEIVTKVFYWLYSPSNFERLRVIVYVKREEKIPSVTDIWEGANWYERELFDMFGVHFENHPDLKRILMPDDWKGHPMLKDYALTEVPVTFKHGVKPKVPSEIIRVKRNQKNY